MLTSRTSPLADPSNCALDFHLRFAWSAALTSAVFSTMSSSSDAEQIYQLKSAIAKLDISSQDSVAELARVFDSVALNLARDEQLR